MDLAGAVRANPRLVPHVGEVTEAFRPFISANPNARIVWVEEYARAVVDGEAHRAGFAAISTDALVLAWRHGAFYRRSSHVVIRRADVASWSPTADGVLITTADGEVSIAFRPGGPEHSELLERLTLGRALGPPAAR